MPETVFQINGGPGILGGDVSVHRKQGLPFSGFAFTQVGFSNAKGIVKRTSFHRFLLDVIPARSTINKAKIDFVARVTNAPDPDNLQIALCPPVDLFGNPEPWVVQRSFFTHSGDQMGQEGSVVPQFHLALIDDVGGDISRGPTIIDGLFFFNAFTQRLAGTMKNRTGLPKILGAVEFRLRVNTTPPAATLFVAEVFIIDNPVVEPPVQTEAGWDVGRLVATSDTRPGSDFNTTDPTGEWERFEFTFTPEMPTFVIQVDQVVLLRLRQIPEAVNSPAQQDIGCVMDFAEQGFDGRRIRLWGPGSGFNVINYPAGADLPISVKNSQTLDIIGPPPFGSGFVVFAFGPLTADVARSMGDSAYSTDFPFALGAMIQEWVDAPFYEQPMPIAFQLDFNSGSTNKFWDMYSTEDPTFGGWQLTIDWTPPVGDRICATPGHDSAVEAEVGQVSAVEASVGNVSAVEANQGVDPAVTSKPGASTAILAGFGVVKCN